jgi:ABC-type uncharacterized transport system substrate-binding protein
MTIRRWASLTALSLMVCAAASPASAHPHVWIEMRSDLVFNDQGQVTAMNLEWTFDDGYAQMALDGLDTNGDGVYSQDELAQLTQENIASLKDYDYFTVIRFNGEKQKLGQVTEFGQIYSNGKLQLHFQVPLAVPLDPTKGEIIAKVYDPDFFIALDYVKDEPVSAIGAMPKTCQIVVKPVPTDAEVEQTRAMLLTKDRDWKPETEEDFGAVFAQPVTVQCKA